MLQDEPVPGPIEGLRLPSRTWNALQRGNVTTLDRLKAVAGRIERVVEGVGFKTAEAIRAELARATSLEKHYQDER